MESEGLKVTSELIERFAELSGDRHPVHMDEKFAEGAGYAGRIAHGLLTASLASGLLFERGVTDPAIVAFAEGRFRFRRPVVVGDVLREESECVDVEEKGQHQREEWRTYLMNGGGEVVMEADWWFVRRK